MEACFRRPKTRLKTKSLIKCLIRLEKQELLLIELFLGFGFTGFGLFLFFGGFYSMLAVDFSLFEFHFNSLNKAIAAYYLMRSRPSPWWWQVAAIW